MGRAGCEFGVVSMVTIPPRAGANVQIEPFEALPPAFNDVALRLPVRAGRRPRRYGGCLMVAPEIDMGRD